MSLTAVRLKVSFRFDVASISLYIWIHKIQKSQTIFQKKHSINYQPKPDMNIQYIIPLQQQNYPMYNLQDYELIDEIGSGSFSTVYKARHKETKEMYAIKKMKEMPRNDQLVVQNEIQLLKRIKHKNIIHFENDFKEKGKWYLVFQYCGKGDLERYRNKHGRIPQAYTKNIIYNILEAVNVLHENKIVHRDLKLANILINDAFDIKLADFGFSKDNESGLMMSYCGTPLTMAPEILQRQPYDQRCDTWSLGVLLYQLIYNKPPFYPNKQFGAGIVGLTNAVLKATPKFDIQIDVSNECKDVILKCLSKKMNDRPTVKDLMEHSWFQSGIRSTIRVGFLKESMTDLTDATSKCKNVLSESVHQSLKRTLKKASLTDSGIKQTLKMLAKYFPENDEIQVLFLLKITEILMSISKVPIHIKIEGMQYKILTGQISKFKTHRDNLKEFIRKQIKSRKSLDRENVNLPRQIIKFVIDNASVCLSIQEQQPEKSKVVSNLSTLCNTEIDETSVEIIGAFSEQLAELRNQIGKYLQKQSSEQVLNMINNDEPSEDDINEYWLVEYNIEKKTLSGLEFLLGDILNKTIRINTFDQFQDNQL